MGGTLSAGVLAVEYMACISERTATEVSCYTMPVDVVGSFAGSFAAVHYLHNYIHSSDLHKDHKEFATSNHGGLP